MGRASTTAMVLVAGTACGAGLIAMRAGHETTAAALPAPAQQGLDLPVTSITLYRSGVASYERRGTVVGDVKARMSVEADQINDLLKSMVLLDLDGGRVEAVSYESRDPLGRRLSSFAIDISDNPGMYTLLERLRGTDVRLETAAGSVDGAVLSVEHWQVVEDGVAVPRGFVTLRTDEGMRTVGIHEVRRFRIADERLADELRLALAAIGEGRENDVKSVDLLFAGDGERRVVVSYVQEAPVWKASYRLVLPETGADGATLQGWAIVENTTDEDWTGVSLSLVAGRPVSFTMDLYEPLYIPRYQAPVPVAAGARPRVYAEGTGGGGGGQGPFSGQTADQNYAYAEKSREQSSRFRNAPAVADRMAPASETMAGMEISDATMGSGAASGGEVGEQFRYHLDEPVSVARRRSAMLPILTEQAGVRRVSIYNASDNARHPMRGVELTNTTGLQLLAGPVSVYDAGAYAGDAQIGHVAPGDERLLAYAVDLDVLADAEQRQDSSVEHVRIVKGVFEQKIKDVRTSVYGFTSKDRSRPRTVIVEHPDPAGWDLVVPGQAGEKADGAMRFEVGIARGGDATLTVTHERVRYQRTGVLGQDIGTLVRYTTQGKASRAVVDAVRRVGELQARVQEARELVGALERERDAIGKDQERIRGNLGRVASGTELHARYLGKLNEQETRLEDIAETLGDARESERAAQATLESYVAGLSVE